MFSQFYSKMSRKVKKGKKSQTLQRHSIYSKMSSLIKITCHVVTMSLQTLWQGGKGNPARTWRGGRMKFLGFKRQMYARMKPTGCNPTMARITFLGCKPILARTSSLGFTTELARTISAGFTAGLAHTSCGLKHLGIPSLKINS